MFSNGISGSVRKLLSNKPKRAISKMPLIVGQTEAIRNIRNMLPCLESSRDPILITGEKGTGKELLARAIGLWSQSDSRFIKIDCAQLLPKMIAHNMENPEAFLGDRSKKRTILLDKIHLLKRSIQAELLLLIESVNDLQTNERTVGNTMLRLIATSENNIEHMVKQGRFRKDLYYRLKVIPISLPPLRFRQEDISLFIDYFLIEACAKLNKSVIIPSDQTREQLYVYDWPGNLSELKKTMQRVALTGDETSAFANERILKHKKSIAKRLPYSIEMEALPSSFEILNYLPGVNNLSLRRICNEFVSRTEKKVMKKALMTTSWNRKKAAGLLNISYKSLLNKIKTYELT
jgi:two-component system response regulator AtoC